MQTEELLKELLAYAKRYEILLNGVKVSIIQCCHI